MRGAVICCIIYIIRYESRSRKIRASKEQRKECQNKKESMGDRKIVELERRRCGVIDVTVDEFEEVNSVKEESTRADEVRMNSD